MPKSKPLRVNYAPKNEEEEAALALLPILAAKASLPSWPQALVHVSLRAGRQFAEKLDAYPDLAKWIDEVTDNAVSKLAAAKRKLPPR